LFSFERWLLRLKLWYWCATAYAPASVVVMKRLNAIGAIAAGTSFTPGNLAFQSPTSESIRDVIHRRFKFNSSAFDTHGDFP